MQSDQVEIDVALDVPFRGERDYVHSTDICAGLGNLARTMAFEGHLKTLTLRRPAYRQVRVQFTPHFDAFGTFELVLAQQVVPGWLVETHSPIRRRIAFDETAIARQAVDEPGQVSLPAPVDGYDGFEQMIVLLKLLCAQSHAGPWLFTAMTLDRPLSGRARLGALRAQVVLGRMIDATLHQDGQRVGHAQMVLALRKE